MVQNACSQAKNGDVAGDLDKSPSNQLFPLSPFLAADVAADGACGS